MNAYIVYLCAYLIGCFPAAVMVCRLKGLPNPRKEGSKNPGATNVLRIGNKSAALTVALIDVFKGFLPVILARYMGVENLALGWVALAVVAGHMFPLFYLFKGGKGIATALGAFIALSWPESIMLVFTWLITLWQSRYSALAGVISAVLAPLYFYLFHHTQYLPAVLFISALIIIRHHGNIKRMLAGEEDKVHER